MEAEGGQAVSPTGSSLAELSDLLMQEDGEEEEEHTVEPPPLPNTVSPVPPPPPPPKGQREEEGNTDSVVELRACIHQLKAQVQRGKLLLEQQTRDYKEKVRLQEERLQAEVQLLWEKDRQRQIEMERNQKRGEDADEEFSRLMEDLEASRSKGRSGEFPVSHDNVIQQLEEKLSRIRQGEEELVRSSLVWGTEQSACACCDGWLPCSW